MDDLGVPLFLETPICKFRFCGPDAKSIDSGGLHPSCGAATPSHHTESHGPWISSELGGPENLPKDSRSGNRKLIILKDLVVEE